MKCGNCKQDHDTVAQVRACYSAPSEATERPFIPITSNPRREPKRGQYELIQDLLAERNMTALPPYDVTSKHLSKSDASEMISDLLKMPKPVAPKQVLEGGAAKFDIAEGYYAVPSLTGNNDMDFFRIDKPTTGKWAGYTFVKRIIGGKPSVAVPRKRVNAVLKVIEDFGSDKAAYEYGQKIGRCQKCNRHLTDEVSRASSAGADCREKYGIPTIDPGQRHERRKVVQGYVLSETAASNMNDETAAELGATDSAETAPTATRPAPSRAVAPTVAPRARRAVRPVRAR